MREVHVSDEAKLDQIGIWEYIAVLASSPQSADKLIQSIVNTYLRLGDAPGVGRERGELRPNIHSIAVQNYVICYRFDESRVFVVRVLHGARNLRAVFRRETSETYTEQDEG